jgi:predicted RNase H-like HicB family nuclease
MVEIQQGPVSREGAKPRSSSIFMGTYIYSILTIKLAMRQVILTPGEDGYWVAEVPSLPGCISQGKTREEALINIKEAIEG